ncbi:MAG: aminotransferase class IV [Bacteroidetes bacterium]|nr:aminotransferase class IV [Bacteroidota bacterium]
MFRFFESILLKDGEMPLLHFHSDRMNAIRKAHFGTLPVINLDEIIVLPCDCKSGVYKIKVTYGKFIESIEFQEYTIKPHKKVRLIENREIAYQYKSVERGDLTAFLNNNPDFDDVIFTKNGLLTDASYSNIALFDGENWFTPSDCLLEGVKRRSLLEAGKIIEKSICVKDLAKYTKIAFINAMRDFEMTYTFRIENEVMFLEITPEI